LKAIARPAFCVLLALFAVSAPSTAGPDAPPAPSAPPAPQALTAGDRLVLGRLGEALVLSRATSGKLWPGWGLEKFPILVFEPGRVAYLVNHPAPPADFVRLETKQPLLGSVFMKTGRDPRFTANTSIDLGGTPTACISYSTAPSEADGVSLKFVALVFHEAFHAMQNKVGKTGKGSVEAILMRYPDLNGENLALAQLEQMILFDLVRFGDAADPQKVRQFLSVRQARVRSVGAEILRADRGIEYQEGIPTYLEVRLLDEAKKAVAASPGLGRDDPYALGFSQAPELKMGSYLMRLLRFSSDPGATRDRGYGTGMALGLILDRLGVDWKSSVLTSEKYLDEFLADAVPLSADAAPASLAAAKKEYRYEEVLRTVEGKLSRLSLDRKAAVDTFLRQKGIEVAVRFPDSPVEVRAFDPMNMQRIDASRTLHRRMLQLAIGETSFSAMDTPILATLGNGPLDVRGVTVFAPEQDFEMDLDFNPLERVPGTREFRTSFRLTADGVNLQALSGTVTVSPDGAHVEVTIRR
jgi:hypothetical protein